MYFGKSAPPSHKLSLNGMQIEWVESWVYLGVTLKSGGKFNCSISDKLRKFYKCLNAILRIEGRSNDLIMLRLLEAHCIPLLTYAIEILHISDQREKSKLRAAYNSIFRKIFGYRQHESVRELQACLGRPTWEDLIEKRKNNFLLRAGLSSPDSLVSAFAS